MNRFFRYIYLSLLFFLIVAIVSGCNSTRYVEDGNHLLTSVKVVSEGETDFSSLISYVRQKPNSKWLSFFNVPLGLYSISGRDTTKWVNRTLRKWGEKPVVYDSTLTDKTAVDLAFAMQNMGYLNAQVEPELHKSGKKAKMIYRLYSGELYHINDLSYDIQDESLDSLLGSNPHLFTIKRGQTFSVNKLNDERKRITEFLTNNGYYFFNKEFIHFDVDSSQAEKLVDVTMHIDKYRRNSYQEAGAHPLYKVRSVKYERTDNNPLNIRQKVLEQNTMIRTGAPYSSSALQQTYNRFSKLQAIRYTNIHFAENPDSMLLDCTIQYSPAKTNSIQFLPEGTNTAGDFGAAASLSYQNRNLFRGSELLNISTRYAFEAIENLEGYQQQNYEEYGVEASVTLPTFLLPGVTKRFKKMSNATTELVAGFNTQNRPEFHRRVFNATWRFKWSDAMKKTQYRFDLLDLNYISMPWISEKFKREYLDSVSNRNAILRYNYEDLLIMKIGFGYTYSSSRNTFRMNLETAGNLLSALSRPLRLDKNGEGQYKIFNIAYAQYVKGDFDYTHLLHLDQRNTLALHARLGIAYPYGNSNILPFEKRYFSGGANSVRGWNVRSLGPGRYTGKDGNIDFINQTGDMRIDLNAEMRSALFWKFQGAVFVDAGNVWTIRDYADQPGGQFRFDTFLSEMAVAYGLGIRLNFDYFIIRFDMGMKAINPAYTATREHYPIIYPNFSRDHSFHFAVGLPF